MKKVIEKMPKTKKKEKVLYDFDYAEEEENKKKKKIDKKKKTATKKKRKNENTEASKKYEDEIIIGVTKIPEKEEKIKKNKNHHQKKKECKKVDENKRAALRNPIYNYDIDYVKEEEKFQKKEKIKRRLKIVLKWLGAIAILAGIICFALLSPIFNIQNIEVMGNSKLTKEEIVSLSKISKNENIFKILTLKAEEQIKQNAYVESVNINKKFPNTIEISIKERMPKFLLKFGNSYVYLNSQGYMLEISSKKLNLPIIIGTKTTEEQYITGNRLAQNDLEKLETSIKIMDVATNNGIESLVTSIDISNENNYKIYFETEKKTAYLGDCSNLETRMLYVVAIIKNEKNIEGEIFVDMNLNSENAFFRENV